MNLPAFFAGVRPLFGGSLSQSQVDGINAILAGFEQHGDGNRRHLAYVLATSWHETAHTMQPIYERGQRSYFDKYEPGTKIGAELDNTVEGDGYKFRGRGLVQLTGRANYRKAGQKMGVDLLTSPDLALQPHISACILIRGMQEGWFTGRKLADFTAFKDMRRVVNGIDRASDIALIADGFLRALEATQEASPTPPNPKTPATEPRKGIRWGVLVVVVAIAAAIVVAAKLIGV